VGVNYFFSTVKSVFNIFHFLIFQALEIALLFTIVIQELIYYLILSHFCAYSIVVAWDFIFFKKSIV